MPQGFIEPEKPLDEMVLVTDHHWGANALQYRARELDTIWYFRQGQPVSVQARYTYVNEGGFIRSWYEWGDVRPDSDEPGEVHINWAKTRDELLLRQIEIERKRLQQKKLAYDAQLHEVDRLTQLLAAGAGCS